MLTLKQIRLNPLLLPFHGLVPTGKRAQPGRHFVKADQAKLLVAASEAAPERGFVERTLVLCSLPRTDQGDKKEYIRRNGPFTLGMSAGINNKLPFGSTPRLLLAWVCTEAVRTGSRKLSMGGSLSDFLSEVGVLPDGSSRPIVQEQMMRLLGCTFTMIYQDDTQTATENVLIGRRTHLWRRPNQALQWDSTIELTEDFFNEICSHPVPVDLNILTALKRSSLGLDIYLWLTYRVHMINREGTPSRSLPWPTLYEQFGKEPSRASDNGTVQAFRVDFKRELKKIKRAWPALKYNIRKGQRSKAGGGFVLLASSTPSILPVEQAKLTSVKPADAVEAETPPIGGVVKDAADDPWKGYTPEEVQAIRAQQESFEIGEKLRRGEV